MIQDVFQCEFRCKSIHKLFHFESRGQYSRNLVLSPPPHLFQNGLCHLWAKIFCHFQTLESQSIAHGIFSKNILTQFSHRKAIQVQLRKTRKIYNEKKKHLSWSKIGNWTNLSLLSDGGMGAVIADFNTKNSGGGGGKSAPPGISLTSSSGGGGGNGGLVGSWSSWIPPFDDSLGDSGFPIFFSFTVV